jgi:hypothetical protein
MTGFLTQDCCRTTAFARASPPQERQHAPTNGNFGRARMGSAEIAFIKAHLPHGCCWNSTGPLTPAQDQAAAAVRRSPGLVLLDLPQNSHNVLVLTDSADVRHRGWPAQSIRSGDAGRGLAVDAAGPAHAPPRPAAGNVVLRLSAPGDRPNVNCTVVDSKRRRKTLADTAKSLI